MDFDYYQDAALGTDQFAAKAPKKDDGLLIPLLGIAGETGTLLAEFKKKIRDRESYAGFKEKAEEEIGDILWYLSNIASRLELSLSEIASKNLQKTYERWPMEGEASGVHAFFDEGLLESEQLPRSIQIRVFETEKGRRAHMSVLPDGTALGDALTDNAYDDDGYRFHDVMHLANMAVLRWSPVMRALLKRKRKSQPKLDEVEDGARAIILEEMVVAFIYVNAKERSYYKDIKHLDSEMLATIKRIVGHLEVRQRRTKDWEQAIQQGYAAFRHLLDKREAVLKLDLTKRQLSIVQ
ncbi:MAG: nucleoside triphosphate pyrophosphohydrolase family protein [Chthoniobacteraceae bacterium]